MRNRFASYLTLAALGGFLVVATQAFSLATIQWLTFGVAAASVLVATGLIAGARKYRSSGILGGLAAVIGVWTVIQSLIFGDYVVMWLGFAGGIALLGVAVVGLIVHELSTERVVHSLEIADQTPQRAAA